MSESNKCTCIGPLHDEHCPAMQHGTTMSDESISREWLMTMGFQSRGEGTYFRPMHRRGFGTLLVVDFYDGEGESICVVKPECSDFHAEKIDLSDHPTKQDVLNLIAMYQRKSNGAIS